MTQSEELIRGRDNTETEFLNLLTSRESHLQAIAPGQEVDLTKACSITSLNKSHFCSVEVTTACFVA